jgi:hypothetical protein
MDENTECIHRYVTHPSYDLSQKFAYVLQSVSGRDSGVFQLVHGGISYWKPHILILLELCPINTPGLRNEGLFNGEFGDKVERCGMVDYLKVDIFLEGRTKYWTPFQYSCYTGNVELVAFMLEQGGDPAIRDGLGRNAIDIARMAERDDLDFERNKEQGTLYAPDYQGVIGIIERGYVYRNFPNFFTNRSTLDLGFSFKDTGFKKKRDDSDSVDNKNFKF